MKCNIHPYESGVGVCATCLRERLLAFVALTERSNHHEPSSLTLSPHHHRQHHHGHNHDHDQPDSLRFPRSVSPYLSHRRSLGESPSLQHHQLFYSTPQVTSTTSGVGIGGGGVPSRDLPRKKRRPFSLLSSLFGFRSNNHQNKVSENLQSAPPDFNSSPFDSGAMGVGSKQSWLSNLVRSQRKKDRENSASTAVSSAFTTREFSMSGMGREGWCDRRRRECRGLSPERGEMDHEEEEWVDSPGSQIPAPKLTRRHRRVPAVGNRGASGFSVFWSPLVRASPQRRCQLGSGEMGFSGEIRNCGSVGNGSGGGPAVLGVNRSKKLADLGRFQ